MLIGAECLANRSCERLCQTPTATSMGAVRAVAGLRREESPALAAPHFIDYTDDGDVALIRARDW